MNAAVRNIRLISMQPVSFAALNFAVAAYAGAGKQETLTPKDTATLWKQLHDDTRRAFEMSMPPMGTFRENLLDAMAEITANIEDGKLTENGALLVSKKSLEAFKQPGLSELHEAARIYDFGQGFDDMAQLIFQIQQTGPAAIARQLRLAYQAIDALSNNSWQAPALPAYGAKLALVK